MLNLLEYLERSAARTPDKLAFLGEDRGFTFGQLLAFARSAGTAVARRTGSVNRPVAVFTDRTAVTLAAFQAVLASGNYYAPIDVHMPPRRMESILEQLGPVLLLYAPGQEERAAALAHLCPALSLAEAEKTAPEETLLTACRERVLDVDPAYAIFTSGSTGAPKGIVIAHRSVIDFTEWMAEACRFSETDILANQAPFYFDLSVKDIYLTLKCGAACHILPKKLFLFPLLLLKEIQRVQATALVWATSAFHLAAASGALEKCAPETLDKVILGGEALRARHLNAWRAALPHVQYINLYGPTEVTVDCTWYPIPRDRVFADGEAVPIGRPCRNKEILLLGEDLQPVPAGEVGEICVRGIGLARGYYGDWDKTQAAFIQDPRNPWYPDRIYRTGDLGRWDGDGLLQFVSRRDGQIKHMGYRIELGEVETALSALPGVPAAVCFFDQERDRIVCCYEGGLSPKALAAALAERLPRYMLPNIWLSQEKLPLNANGKVDRVALKEAYFNGNSS